MPQVAAAALLAAVGQRHDNSGDETLSVPNSDNPTCGGEASSSTREPAGAPHAD